MRRVTITLALSTVTLAVAVVAIIMEGYVVAIFALFSSAHMALIARELYRESGL